MPIRTFWFLTRCIDRIAAERDLRTLAVTNAAQSEDGYGQYRKSLIIELEAKSEVEDALNAERDEEGFAELRRMAESM